MFQKIPGLALLFTLVFAAPPTLADAPEFTWLNQFAGFPERVLQNAKPYNDGLVGSTGTRISPMSFRAPDGSLECHMLIRYANGAWSTTGDIGVATPGNCGTISGSTPVRDVTPFRTSICIGGSFANLGPDNLNNFACYTEGGTWQQINGPGNGPNNVVEALAFDGFNVYVGGSFTEVNGTENTTTPVNRIVRTDGINWEPLFSDNAETSNGVNGTVTAILPTNSFVYAGVNRSVRRWNNGANDKWSDLGSANSGVVRDIELNATLVAAVAANSTTWGGLPAGSVSEFDPGDMEWSAVGSSSAINTGSSKLAVAGGFFHATGDFSAVDPDARGVARLALPGEWEAVPGSLALGDFPIFLDLLQMNGELCGVQQGQFTGQTFFSRGISCNDGNEWRGLAQGVQGEVLDLVKYNGAVVAGGKITAAGDRFVNYIAEYRSGGWRQLGDGLGFVGAGSTPGDVRAMTVFRGELHAMGLFNEADGVAAPGLAAWNGQRWRSVGEGMNSPGDIMLVWDGKLIMTGFTPSGLGPVVSWDGTSFAELPAFPGNRTPTAMAVYNGELIAAYRPSGNAFIVRLEGASWEPLTPPTVSLGGDVNVLLTRGNLLYAGGTFLARQAGQVFAEQVALWDGSNWSGTGEGLQSSFFGVEDLAFVGDDLVAIGWFDRSGTTSLEKLAYFDGTEWFSLGPGLFKEFTGSTGKALMVDGETVYVGGSFEQAGNVWSDNIGAFEITGNIVYEDGFEVQ